MIQKTGSTVSKPSNIELGWRITKTVVKVLFPWLIFHFSGVQSLTQLQSRALHKHMSMPDSRQSGQTTLGWCFAKTRTLPGYSSYALWAWANHFQPSGPKLTNHWRSWLTNHYHLPPDANTEPQGGNFQFWHAIMGQASLGPAVSGPSGLKPTWRLPYLG